MTALALVLVGIALAVIGVRVALERARPINLAGMILAPLGLGLTLLGAGRWLSPDFLARTSGEIKAVPLRVMPAGDAVTRGAGRSRAGGYRGPLWSRLTRTGRAVDFVGAERGGPYAIDRDHESWDEVTVDGLAARLVRDLPTYRPEVILLCVGANDVAAGAPAEVVAGRLASLLDAVAARDPHVETLVAPLVSVIGPGGLDRVTATNTLIRALVVDRAARGARVRFVDMNARIPPPGLDSLTGDVPLDPSFAIMADAWAEALRPYFAGSTNGAATRRR